MVRQDVAAERLVQLDMPDLQKRLSSTVCDLPDGYAAKPVSYRALARSWSGAHEDGGAPAHGRASSGQNLSRFRPSDRAVIRPITCREPDATVRAAAANLHQGDAVMIQGSLDAGHRVSPLDQSHQRRALVGNLIKRLIAWFKSRYRMRRAVDELMALDDRMLADIGLGRGEILYAVRHSRERRRFRAGE